MTDIASKEILIAEDEPYIVESLSFILEREGYTISRVEDGNHVVAHVRARRPGALILDLMLPNRNGFEILKDLKADPELRDIPVLMLTAKGQQQDRTTAEELKVDAFITKPYSNRAVVACIRELTGHTADET